MKGYRFKLIMEVGLDMDARCFPGRALMQECLNDLMDDFEKSPASFAYPNGPKKTVRFIGKVESVNK